MKYLVSALSILLFSHAQAAGTVDYLKIDKDVVLFSTTETNSAASPTCVANENTGIWSASLRSESGRAMYALLTTAVAKNMDVEVTSANDCADADEFERAEAVDLVFSDSESTASDSGVGLYKGDGVTRLGTVIGMGPEANSFYYASTEDQNSALFIENFMPDQSTNKPIFFSGANCTGTKYYPYTPNLVLSKPALNGGEVYYSSATRASRTYKSNFYSTACIANSGTVNTYTLSVYNHPVCGNKPCIVRSE